MDQEQARRAFEELLESPIFQIFLKSLGKLATELEQTVQEQVISRGYLRPSQQVLLADYRGQAKMAREISLLDFDRFEAIVKGEE